jgi:hypothetical protein
MGGWHVRHYARRPRQAQQDCDEVKERGAKRQRAGVSGGPIGRPSALLQGDEDGYPACQAAAAQLPGGGGDWAASAAMITAATLRDSGLKLSLHVLQERAQMPGDDEPQDGVVHATVAMHDHMPRGNRLVERRD